MNILVILSEYRQMTVTEREKGAKFERLMKRWLKTVQLAVEGEKNQNWKVKSEHRSPNYLTELGDILEI